MDDFGLDELKLAFSYHIVNQILDADGVVAPAETRFLQRTFPRKLFEFADFVGKGGGSFTERWREALGEALLVLPTRPRDERLGIVRTLFDAAMADDSFAAVEANVVRRAARLLALDPEDVSDMIDTLILQDLSEDTTEQE